MTERTPRERAALGYVMYLDMDGIRAAAATSRYSQHWFDEEHMRAFHTRLGTKVYDAGPHGAFFTASGQPDPELKRAYTVYHVDPDGNIRPVDGDAPVLPGLDLSLLGRSAEADRKASIAAAAAQLKPVTDEAPPAAPAPEQPGE